MPGITGQPALSKAALEIAHKELRLGLRSVVNTMPLEMVTEALTKRAIRTYLQAYRTEAKPKISKAHPDTIRLTQMKIGETEVFASRSRHNWSSKLKSARNIMDDPVARWSISVREHNTVISRLDYSEVPPTHDPYRNARANFLAEMKPWEIRQTKGVFKDKHSISTNTKIAARKILGQYEANWRVKTLGPGLLEITRIR